MSDWYAGSEWFGGSWFSGDWFAGEQAAGAMSATLTGSGGIVGANLVCYARMSATLTGSGGVTGHLTATPVPPTPVAPVSSGGGGNAIRIRRRAPRRRAPRIYIPPNTKMTPLLLSLLSAATMELDT